MSFALKSVIEFCDAFEKAFTKQMNIYNTFSYDNISSWDPILGKGFNDYLKEYPNKLLTMDSQYKSLNETRNRILTNNVKNLQAYINLVKNAANYLQGKAPFSERQQELDTAVEFLLKIYRKHFFQYQISEPSDEKGNQKTTANEFADAPFSTDFKNQATKEKEREKTSTQYKPLSQQPVKSIEVREFFETNLFFEALKNHRSNILYHDSRSHSFFGASLAVEEKYTVLRQFTMNLCEANSMIQIRRTLDELYLGKGIEGSPYEILNKGQNITTRFFGLKTTTMELIDKMHESLPPIDAEMLQEGKSTAREDFLRSGLFEGLKKYRSDVLYRDSRNHSWFGMSFEVKEKYATLESFIHDLSNAPTMYAIRKKLDDFYLGKGIKDSYYEVLNKGQNVTTSVLGLKTTTMELIDRLNTLANSKSFDTPNTITDTYHCSTL